VVFSWLALLILTVMLAVRPAKRRARLP
jgi:hypothetical protein